MSRNFTSASRFTLHVLVVLTLLAACALTPKVTSEVSPKIDQYRVKTVVVLPFEALATSQTTERPRFDEMTVPQGARRSDISVSVPPTGERIQPVPLGVSATAAERVTRSLYGKLKDREGVRVFAPDDATAALKSLEGEVNPEQRPARVATKMALDAALIGRVLVYQERKGSKLGGDTAAVGFEVKLVAADGTTLWIGNYYEKQKPLTEDAQGSLERGFVFVTADELVDYGAARLAEQFPFGAKAKR